MGLMIDGLWHSQWYDTGKSAGHFVREDSQFRHWVTVDGAPGPGGEGGFCAEAGRYHLYVSLACPWAHRTLIFRKLKGLENVISVSIVHPHMLEHGWVYSAADGATLDSVNGFNYHWQLYNKALPGYSGRVTVPVLWDKKRATIVNNESSEIIRMFNSAFAAFTDNDYDYYPEPLRNDIDEVNTLVYEAINNGVYRCGFATSQPAYEEAFAVLFAALDVVEERLSRQRYLVNATLTEADWRLFTTLVRFDAVYVGHFKCNLRRIADYPNVSNYLRELYQVPGIASTVNFEHIKQHYYYSHDSINPTRIVPQGPLLDLDKSHDRQRFGQED
jgi:putative glutathione S-transferase